jgi:UDP-N-acetylglucosamine 4,6-dehydratase/UDP-glucose 4-epimerase
MKIDIQNLDNILITGGTGFLGKALIKRIYKPDKKIRVMARSEGSLISLKQEYPNIEIMTGSVCDDFMSKKSAKHMQSIFHLAAFKHVGQAETQPVQCVKSNVTGTMNMLSSYCPPINPKNGVFLNISTDKAAQVNGVYGASKLLAERMITEYSKYYDTYNFRTVRYGNVLYSTGSVLCKWKDALINSKQIIVTELEATRFFWTVDSAIDLIEDCLSNAVDSTPYCPNMKAMKIDNLLTAMIEKYSPKWKETKIKIIGLQPGENLHEKVLEEGPYSNEVELYTVEEIMEMV